MDFETRRQQFLLPPKTDIESSSWTLSRGLLHNAVPVLWIATALVLAIALWSVAPTDRPDSFQRSGNLVILLGLSFGLWSFRMSGLMDRVTDVNYQVFYEVEKAKHPHFTDAQAWDIARLRVNRVLPTLKEVIARRLVPHELLVVSLGTFIAGYGDLLLGG